MSEPEPAQQPEAAPARHQDFDALPQLRRVTRWLESGQEIIQVAAGVLLFLGAFLAIGYAVFHFIDQLATATQTLAAPNETIHLDTQQNLATTLINLMSDILLVLIIAEIFNTILHYLRERTVYLKPFLFIVIISASRDLLATSARLALLEVQEKEFIQLMEELAINLVIILGLSLALRLIRKEDASDPL